jgi:hypothetical protein
VSNVQVTSTSVTIDGQCGYCHGFHSGKCPKVKAWEYHEGGGLKRVEFFDDQALMWTRPQWPLVAESIEADLRELRNEIDCRIEHGADGAEHLRYIYDQLELIWNKLVV